MREGGREGGRKREEERERQRVPPLCRLMVVLMAMCFYLTGFLKNTLCLPRPPAPPIIPLQHCQDWSLPSHHAVLNVAVPWFLWFYLTLTYRPPSLTLCFLFPLISLWSFCVMFSRMYLGVHSPADIFTGGMLGCLLLALWMQWYEGINLFLSGAISPSSALAVLCVVVCLLAAHPDPYPVTIVFAETVCMVGVAVGFVLAGVVIPSYGRAQGLLEQRHAYASIPSIVVCSVLRYTVGLIAMVMLKNGAELVVRTVLRLVAQATGIPTVCIKRRSEVTSERVHFSSAFIVTECQVQN